jgi:carboxymethylenebutenolidase
VIEVHEVQTGNDGFNENQPSGTPVVVIAGFENGKVTHEHIYWDQAGALVQTGLLNTENLPVHDVETARRMNELRTTMQQ